MFYYFIGTEAELIKTYPVIKEMNNRGIPYKLISSGQNDLSQSRVLKYATGGKMDLLLSREDEIKKSGLGLLSWFIKTKRSAKRKIVEKFPEISNDNNKDIMIVHGDTISTVMGAYLAKSLGMRIAHIEAGLRSHNCFNPFPEEIDRILTDRISDYLFIPGEHIKENVKRYKKATIIDTVNNTLVDSMYYSVDVDCGDPQINDLITSDYFVFVLHRQENMNNEQLIRYMVSRVEKEALKKKCVIILHKITEVKFERMGILDRLKQNDNIVLLPRVDYFDFMKLLSNAKFVVTDGGSNQGELYYMGVPTLIVRYSTEQKEGLGENILLFEGKYSNIDYFFENYDSYRREKKENNLIASKNIVDAILL